MAVLVAQIRHSVELVGSLDPFGNQGEIESFADGRYSLWDRLALLRFCDVLHKATIEFYGVDGEAGQTFQRRVTSAKVVDGKTDAEVLECVQYGKSGFFDGEALDDFEADGLRRSIRLG